jgi:hypothetical protein
MLTAPGRRKVFPTEHFRYSAERRVAGDYPRAQLEIDLGLVSHLPS